MILYLSDSRTYHKLSAEFRNIIPGVLYFPDSFSINRTFLVWALASNLKQNCTTLDKHMRMYVCVYTSSKI